MVVVGITWNYHRPTRLRVGNRGDQRAAGPNLKSPHGLRQPSPWMVSVGLCLGLDAEVSGKLEPEVLQACSGQPAAAGLGDGSWDREWRQVAARLARRR